MMNCDLKYDKDMRGEKKKNYSIEKEKYKTLSFSPSGTDS